MKYFLVAIFIAIAQVGEMAPLSNEINEGEHPLDNLLVSKCVSWLEVFAFVANQVRLYNLQTLMK